MVSYILVNLGSGSGMVPIQQQAFSETMLMVNIPMQKITNEQYNNTLWPSDINIICEHRSGSTWGM